MSVTSGMFFGGSQQRFLSCVRRKISNGLVGESSSIDQISVEVHPRELTCSLKRGKDRFPTIHFLGSMLVSGRVDSE